MRCWVLLAACAASVTPLYAAPVPYRLVLKPEVTVQRAEVTVGDIAEIAPAPAASTWRAIPIGRAPAAGSTVRIPAESVRYRLRQAGITTEMASSSASTCTVRREAILVTPDMLAEAACQFVIEQQAETGGEVTAVPAGRPPAVTCPEGTLQLAPRLMGPPSGALQRVAVTVRVDGVQIAEPTVTIRVRRMVDALTAVRALSVDTPITPDAVTVTRIDASSLTGEALTADTPLAGLSAAMHVGQGTVLTRRNTRPLPTVRRGQSVIVRTQRGAVRIQAQGAAMDDAAPGYPCRVRVASGQTVTGTVTRDNEVEVR